MRSFRVSGVQHCRDSRVDHLSKILLFARLFLERWVRQDHFIVSLRLHVYVLHIRMCSRMTHGSIYSGHGETSAQKKLNVHLWHAGLAAGYLHAAWKTHQPETVFAPRWEMRQAARLQ